MFAAFSLRYFLLSSLVILATTESETFSSGDEPSEDPRIKGQVTDVRVTCTATSMTVEVSPSKVPFYKPEEITFLDTKCKAKLMNNLFTLKTDFKSCGMQTSQDDDIISFRNIVIGMPDTIDKIITKKSDYSQAVYCVFNKRTRTMLSTELKPKLPIIDGSDLISDAPFEVSLELNNKNGDTLSAGSVLSVTAGETVYFSVVTDSPLFNVAAKRCFITSTKDPEDDLFYDLITNGCKSDDTVQYHGLSKNGQRYSFDSFSFVKDISLPLTLHCDVVGCPSDDKSSFCVNPCPPFSKRHIITRSSYASYLGRLSVLIIRK